MLTFKKIHVFLCFYKDQIIYVNFSRFFCRRKTQSPEEHPSDSNFGLSKGQRDGDSGTCWTSQGVREWQKRAGGKHRSTVFASYTLYFNVSSANIL